MNKCPCTAWLVLRCRHLHRVAGPAAALIPALPVVLLLLATAQPASAVYRCDGDGKISYADLPCPGAAPVRIDAPPPLSPSSPPTSRPASQTTATPDSHQRQAVELARLQQLRELRERQDQRLRDLAARGAAARDKKCRSLQLQMRWREEDVRDASLRHEAQARKRLRRTEERYRDECR